MKRSLLVEADGGPLAVVIAGANVPDPKLLARTLEAVVVARPQPRAEQPRAEQPRAEQPRAEQPQHLCLDKAYATPTGEAAVADHGSVPPIRRIGEQQQGDPATGEQRFPARRWVVERTLAWLSTCRALLVRYDKHAANFLGLLQLACALLCFRRLHRLSHLR